MNTTFRTVKKRLCSVALGIALGTALLGSSCAKKAQDIPTPAVEKPVGPSITGRVQPAGAPLSVSLVDITTRQTIASTGLDAQGAYQFEAVPAGTFELLFISEPGYLRPRQRRVTVTAGQTTVVPVVTVVQSTASLITDGVALTPTFVDLSRVFGQTTTSQSGLFSIFISDDQPGRVSGTYRLYLSMPYAARVGSTYSLDGTSAYAIFNEFTGVVFDSRLNPPVVSSGGTLTITAIENTHPYPHFVSGTFRFTGTDPALNTQKTFSGTFENASF